MKKFLTILIMIAFMVACGPTRKAVKTEISDGVLTSVNYMKTLETSYFFPYQIDSAITAERIQPMDKWYKNVLRNAETNEPIEQYLYIKNVENGQINYKVYKLSGYDSLYVYKKIIYNE